MAGADMEGSCKPQTGDAGTCGARSDSRICINATQERWSEERSEASAREGNAQAQTWSCCISGHVINGRAADQA